MGFFSRKTKDKEKSKTEQIEALDLEEEILSETGGGNNPNIGCDVSTDSSPNIGCDVESS